MSQNAIRKHQCPTCGLDLQEDTTTVDVETGVIISNRRFTHLPLAEFELFLLLWEAKGRTLTKESLMTRMYGARPGEDPEIKIVDVVVCKIRRKLKPLGINIETCWGRGYRLSQKQGSQKADD